MQGQPEDVFPTGGPFQQPKKGLGCGLDPGGEIGPAVLVGVSDVGKKAGEIEIPAPDGNSGPFGVHGVAELFEVLPRGDYAGGFTEEGCLANRFETCGAGETPARGQKLEELPVIEVVERQTFPRREDRRGVPLVPKTV
jgi:hypothetical protein